MSDIFTRFHSDHPFCNGSFHRLLEQSSLLSDGSGWTPYFIEDGESLLPGYIKSHSYGEYIFDWAWADFYQRLGRNYYPKMVHTLPFTPINAPKIIGEFKESLLEKSKDYYLENAGVSSQHYLFTTEQENDWLTRNGYLLKETLQYHFTNKYENFDDFLSHLKTRKRKNIKKEREAVVKAGLQIDWLGADELTTPMMKKIFHLYLTTISKKQSHAYLNESFFLLAPELISKELKILVAKKEDEIIAMSLFIEGADCLYGRYWGIDPYYESEYPFLHFELCYYIAMEYCFEKKIPLFEAGAQGEHKLLRGFEPAVITSCHHLREEAFHQAIKEHLVEHNAHNREVIDQLSQHLPFKKKS